MLRRKLNVAVVWIGTCEQGHSIGQELPTRIVPPDTSSFVGRLTSLIQSRCRRPLPCRDTGRALIAPSKGLVLTS